MTLFSYVVRWDHGFAPNPFHGVCSLATCKPPIRSKAVQGDWVLGTGSAEREFAGRAIFLMRVDAAIPFNDYWSQYPAKRPVMNGSLKQRFGDNIYHQPAGGDWQQADSRHSRRDGTDDDNLRRDTSVDQVLIGREFIYWGREAPVIPARFSQFVIARPGWEDKFSDAAVQRFVDWAYAKGDRGRVGLPVEWRYERWWR